MTKLYVGGLSFNTTSEALREHFAQCGAVSSAEVVTDRGTGASRGFGFIEMANDAEAQDAIKRFDGHELDGRPLRVNVANPKREGGRGREPRS